MITMLRKNIWNFLSRLYPMYLRFFYSMNIDGSAKISYKANLDKSIYPKGIYIGKNSWVLSGVTILSHDYSRSLKIETRVGENCIIGINSIIMSGVSIGNNSVVGAGAVVTKNVSSNTIVAGNPAKMIKNNINVYKGKII